MKRFKFFYREGCHLCEDMFQLLQPYENSHKIVIETLNIDHDPELYNKYNLLIPVLCDVDENEICHYFFDKHSFDQILND